MAVINPKLYSSRNIDPVENEAYSDMLKEKVSDALKKAKEEADKKGAKFGLEQVARVYVEVATKEKVKTRDAEFMDLDDADFSSPFKLKGIKSPVEKHSLTYDSFGESLEPVYFWIVDNARGKKTKLVDNFSATPSSGMFGELGMRATKMQEEAMKILGSVNVVIKSALNIIYDLKEFKMRLETYKDFKSEDKAKKNAAYLSLKQIWLDKVDINRGNTSIKAMAQQFDYVTLIDAFMAAESTAQLNITKEGEKGYIDLNERVRRLLLQRFGDFERWIGESEQELTKRYNIEKNYLKSQMASLRLYVRWLKPYLRAAKEMEMTQKDGSADLVSVFNTSILELKLLVEGDRPQDVDEQITSGDIPNTFKKLIEKKQIKDFYTIMTIELSFRQAPERMQQSGGGYGFRGKVDITFASYALDKTELEIFKKAVEVDDDLDAESLIEQATGESMDLIEKDIKEFLEDKKKADIIDEKKDDSNPFTALFSFLKLDDKNAEKKDYKDYSKMSKDSDYDEIVRSIALVNARRGCRKLYDIYKKTHGMPAFPGS
jgi:hypothetical protein